MGGKVLEEKVLQKLEYDQVINILAEKCTSRLGKELALGLKPITVRAEIEIRQRETSVAKEILRLYPEFSLGGLRDLRSCLNKAKKGGVLEPNEFLKITATLSVLRQVKRFFSEKNYPLLEKYVADLPLLAVLEKQIKKQITKEGLVSDRATQELFRLRCRLKNLKGKVREKLDSLIHSPQMVKFLQEPLITIRNQRFVLPVKQEYRSEVAGIVHDQSASGATLFIEPLAVVELNNELDLCEVQERAEVTRILRSLSELVTKDEQDLRRILYSLAKLDLILAKAKLSTLWDCGEPCFNERGYLKIVQGRHPLLSGKVVPITIELGAVFDALIITGPNTGGKTVTLKTVGLFVLMAQTGLHLPAETGTELAVFKNVYADIGDEQSLQQSLSTFSAHLKNIIRILKQVDENSLVLLDELGAGTDPTEGAALAKAILEYFIQSGAKTIATTHYSELKSFAYHHSRVENASVEFDVETLRPTYRLLIGIPGKSNALVISEKLGLPSKLVDRARAFLSQEAVRTADLIANLEREQLLAEKEHALVVEYKKEVAEELAKLKQRAAELEKQKQEIRRQAQKEAWEITKQARQESEAWLKEFKEARKKMDRQALGEMEKIKNELRKKEAILAEEVFRKKSGKSLKIEEIKVGMSVFLNRFKQQGYVLEEPNEKGQVLVQAGIMRLLVDLRDLSTLEEETVEANGRTTGIGKIVSSKAKNINSEIHLRGFPVDEALLEVEKYLDDAYLAGLPKVRIIHGKGTGTLRSAITRFLQNHHLVASFRLGDYYEGGQGVTIVELAKK